MTSTSCELCEAARFTEWFHEDEQCWIAECESCSLPMVVWRVHDPHPPEEVKAQLHAKLRAIVEQHFEGAIRIDDHLRTIDTHYHAHARSIGGPFELVCGGVEDRRAGEAQMTRSGDDQLPAAARTEAPGHPTRAAAAASRSAGSS